jgi:hypothetical protein
MKKRAWLSPKTPALLGAIALLCLTFASAAGQEAPQTLSNGLTRVPATKVQLAYLRPGTDLTKYKSIHIQRLVVPSTVRDTKPKGERPRPGESYLLRDQDVADIQKLYDQAFRKVFTGGGFSVVDTPQAGTLIVATEVTNITLKAPLEDTRNAGQRQFTISEGGGSISIRAAMADGGSGEVIAGVADSAYANNLWQRNTRVQNIADLSRIFSGWARALEKRMAGSSG